MSKSQNNYKKKVVSIQNELRAMIIPIDNCYDQMLKMKMYANFDLDKFERKFNELKLVFKLIQSTSTETNYFNDFVSNTDSVIYGIRREKMIILEASQKVYGIPMSSITFVN